MKNKIRNQLMSHLFDRVCDQVNHHIWSQVWHNSCLDRFFRFDQVDVANLKKRVANAIFVDFVNDIVYYVNSETYKHIET